MSVVARRRLVALLALVALGVAVWLAVRGGSADERGANVEEITIASEAVDRSLPVTVVTPENAAEDAPLLVFLHGRDGNEDSGLVDEMFAALDDLGDRAPSSRSRTAARRPTGTTARTAPGASTCSTR